MKNFILGMIVAGSIVGVSANATLAAYQTLSDTKEQRIQILEEKIDKLEATNRELKAENEFLNKWTSWGEWKITFYWPGEDEFGNLTSTGVIAKEGRTIAVDPSIIPYGTEVLIDGNVYIAEDCGSAVKGKVIDIFVEEPYEEIYHTEIFIKGEISQWNYVIY